MNWIYGLKCECGRGCKFVGEFGIMWEFKENSKKF